MIHGATMVMVTKIENQTKDGLKYISRYPACKMYADSLSKDLAAAVMHLQLY